MCGDEGEVGGLLYVSCNMYLLIYLRYVSSCYYVCAVIGGSWGSCGALELGSLVSSAATLSSPRPTKLTTPRYAS
jgi:hypothetical protein